MGARGSGSRLAPALVALAAVVAGVAAMPLAAFAARGLGLQAALVLGELTLAGGAAVGLIALRGMLGREALAFGPLSPGEALAALAYGGSLWLASLGLVGLQQLVWPPPDGYLEAFAKLHEVLAPRSPGAAALALLAIAVAPAACEELSFRGVAQPGLRPLLGRAGSVIAASLAFGSIHIDPAGGGVTAWRVPFAIAVGLGLGILRERSGRLLPTVLAHAGLNALTWSVVALVGTEAEGAGPAPGAAVAALVVGCGALALLLRRRWRPAPPARTLA